MFLQSSSDIIFENLFTKTFLIDFGILDCTVRLHELLIVLILARDLLEHVWVLTNNHVAGSWLRDSGSGLGAWQESAVPHYEGAPTWWPLYGKICFVSYSLRARAYTRKLFISISQLDFPTRTVANTYRDNSLFFVLHCLHVRIAKDSEIQQALLSPDKFNNLKKNLSHVVNKCSI